MKKVTSVFMAFVLLFALTACNSGGASGGGKDREQKGNKGGGELSGPASQGPVGAEIGKYRWAAPPY